MKILAEIAARSSPDLRPGTLRRSDLESFEGLLEELAGARAVLVTGDVPARRGTAVGMAAAAAAAGTRTALLECDMAEPGMADALGLAAAPGLHEYLLGTAGSEEILKPVVLAGPGSAAATEPLVCVVAGRPAADTAVLLGLERFRHAVASLRGAYGLLVIDGPPPTREEELYAAMAEADVTLGAVDRGAEGAPQLPAPIGGIVVHG